MQVRVVTRERELDLDIPEVVDNSTDSQIIAAVERRLETELKGYMVTREKGKALVSPSPVFG